MLTQKICQTEVVIFQIFFEKSKFSFACFEQSSHLWTMEMQNLDSTHQSYGPFASKFEAKDSLIGKGVHLLLNIK